MSFSSQLNRIAHTGNGATTGFSFPFRIHDSGDIAVYLSGTLTAAYTVDFVSTVEGGTVNMTAAPAIGVQVLIYRRLTLAQAFIELALLSRIPEPAVEAAFDRAVMMAVQLQEQINRAPKFDLHSTIANIGMDNPVATQYLRYNADGTRIESVELAIDPAALAAAVAAAQAAAQAAEEAAASILAGAVAFDVTASSATNVTGESYDATEYRAVDYIAYVKQSTTINVRHDFSLIAINGTWYISHGARRFGFDGTTDHTVDFTISQAGGVVQLQAAKGAEGNASVVLKKSLFAV